MPSLFWTEERVDRLKTLNADGVSAARIAQEIGAASRNAVVGKLHRLGLQRQTPAQPGKAKAVRKARRPGATQLTKVRARKGGARVPKGPACPPVIARARFKPAFVVPDGAVVVDYADLTPRMCQWPYGETLPFQFCGAGRTEGSPYCETHAGVAAAKPGNHPFDDEEASDDRA